MRDAGDHQTCASTLLHNQRCKARTAHLSGVLQCKGYEVEWEQHIRIVECLRKPNLVATIARLALVIEAHIVGDNFEMMAAREAKI